MLQSLPDTVANCSLLTHFYVRDLTQLPATIFSTRHFQELLSLNKQTLQEIPSSIDQLKSELAHLEWSGYESLKQLPSTIGSLHKLETINLEECKSLEALPPEMRRLSALKTLAISSCERLECLP